MPAFSKLEQYLTIRKRHTKSLDNGFVLENRSYRARFRLTSATLLNSEFPAFLFFVRYSEFLPEDFSVGLSLLKLNELERDAILVRAQGPHGGFTQNINEGMIHHNTFHVHKLTDDDFNNKRGQPSHPEAVDQFASMQDALHFMVKYCNIETDSIEKIFANLGYKSVQQCSIF